MATAIEVLKENGFFFPVGLTDLYTIDNQKAPKCAVINEDTREVLGCVSPSYQPVCNEDAFGFIDNLEGFSLLRYGSRWTGHSFVIGSLPDVDILGDKHEVHVILENSFDGTTPVRATYCMLRIVCENQLATTWCTTPALVRLTHTRTGVSQLEDAKNVMLGGAEYISQYIASAEKLAKVRLNPLEMRNILTEYLRVNDAETDRVRSRLLEQRTAIEANIQEENLGNFQGTGWALINGITRYNSHAMPLRQTKEDWEQKRYFQNSQGSLFAVAEMIARVA